MQAKKIILFILSIIYAATLSLTEIGCATIMPPTGGPRDSIAPMLLKSLPTDSTLNFNAEKIVLTFNEYVEISNNPQDIIITPIPQDQPQYSRKLNTITIKLKDSLEPNTTYMINFGNAIKDLNEGNVLKGASYIFSTGTYFDSLKYTGKVILAETGLIDSTLIVMLHTDLNDSAITQKKPKYATRVKSDGSFQFDFLPRGKYAIYALKDESGSYRYFGSNQLFAFADSVIEVGDSIRPVTLYAFDIKDPNQAPTSSIPGGRPNKKADEFKRLIYTTSPQNGGQSLLTPFSFLFENNIVKFDSTLLTLHTDSTFKPVQNYRWVLDSTRQKLSLEHIWKENTTYHIIMKKDFATDTLGQQLLKSDTLSFKTKSIGDYATLNFSFKNLDSTQQYALILFQENRTINTYSISDNKAKTSLLEPGSYTIKILNDKNANGKWDAGQFFEKRIQPEIVVPISTPIIAKPRWENNYEIDIQNPGKDTKQEEEDKSSTKPGPTLPGRPSPSIEKQKLKIKP